MNSSENISFGYYSFGAPMPGRSFNLGTYKYGFNGKENDGEMKGEGNSYDFEARIYDPRVGKFLSTDPAEVKYPDVSPFAAFGNNPILFVDKDGKEIYIYPKNGSKPVLYVPNQSSGSKDKFVRQTEKALNYLYAQDSKGIIGKIARDKEHENVNISFADGANAFGSSKTTGEVTYNPSEGQSFSNEINAGTQSPALRLYHEIAHQYGRIFEPKEYEDRAREGTEEQYIIDEYENHIAKALGEPQRVHHNEGAVNTVKDVTTHSVLTAKEAAAKEDKFQKQVDKDISSGMFEKKSNKKPAAFPKGKKP